MQPKKINSSSTCTKNMEIDNSSTLKCDQIILSGKTLVIEDGKLVVKK